MGFLDVLRRAAFGNLKGDLPERLGEGRNMFSEARDAVLPEYAPLRGFLGGTYTPDIPLMRGYTVGSQELPDKTLTPEQSEYMLGFAGAAQPIWNAAGKISFKTVDPFAGVLPTAGAKTKLGKAISSVSEDARLSNPAMLDAVTGYVKGESTLGDLKAAYTASNSGFLNTGERLSAVDMANQSANPLFRNYTEQKQPVSRGGNSKTGQDAINTFDTSKGCATGFCTACYGRNCSNQARVIHGEPVPVELKGSFDKAVQKNENAIFRGGETGEPNLNPVEYQRLAPELKAAAERKGSPLTAEETDAIIGSAYDWSYTVDQLRKTGFDSPEAAKKAWMITKLHSLEGFDPSVIRNLQVSVDPGNPRHFFRTLENVDTLLTADPTMNIQLRMKTFPSASDEFNSLQLAGYKFAKDRGLDVLETRTRVRSGEQAASLGADESVRKFGNQIGDPSYVDKLPREKAKKGQELYSDGTKTSGPGPITATAEDYKRIRSGNEQSAGSFMRDFVNAEGKVCNALNDFCGTCKNCRSFVGKGTPFGFLSEPLK